MARLRTGLLQTIPRMKQNGSFLYEALMRAMVDDDELVAFAAEKDPAIPMRLFFAVHFLLLKNPEWPLADYFQSITPEPAPPEQAYEHFKRYCFAHAEAVRALMLGRTVQTTTVERAACLLPALARAAAEAEPLSIIEIGCSGGILLVFDEYRFDYGPGGSVGVPDARVTVALPVTGRPFRAPEQMPRIARRIGLDLDPVDPRDPDNHLWIMANLFPEWVAQRQRLDAALKVRAAYPLETYKGDAIALLPDLMAQIRGPICIVHSGVMNYLSDAARATIETTLEAESHSRPVHKVGLDITLQELEGGSHRLILRHTRYEGGVAKVQTLGDADLLGQRLNWTAED